MVVHRSNTHVGVRRFWSPSQLPSLRLWLDASDLATVTVDGNGLCSQLLDKSGYGNHAIQSGADALKPTWALDPTFNNRGVLGFDGAKYMLGSMALAGDNCVIATVAQQSTGITTSANLFSITSVANADTTSTDGVRVGRAGAATQMRFIYNNINGTGRGVTIDAPFIGLFVKDASLGGWSTAVNGNNLNIEAAPGTLATSRYAVGVNLLPANAVGAAIWFGKIAEILIFNSNLDVPTQRKIEGYLTSKYGVQNALLSSHIYRRSAPWN